MSQYHKGQFGAGFEHYTVDETMRYRTAFVHRQNTTLGAPVGLSLDGNAPDANVTEDTSNRILLRDHTTSIVKAYVVGHRSDDAESAAYEVTAVVLCVGGTAILTSTITVLHEDVPAWGVPLSAGADRLFQINGLQATAVMVQWAAVVHITEIGV